MEFFCRKCGKVYDVPPEDFGKRLDCVCGNHFTPTLAKYQLFAANSFLCFHCPKCDADWWGRHSRRKYLCPCGGKPLSPMDLALASLRELRRKKKPDSGPWRRRWPVCCALALMLLIAAALLWGLVSCIRSGAAVASGIAQ